MYTNKLTACSLVWVATSVAVEEQHRRTDSHLVIVYITSHDRCNKSTIYSVCHRAFISLITCIYVCAFILYTNLWRKGARFAGALFHWERRVSCVSPGCHSARPIASLSGLRTGFGRVFCKWTLSYKIFGSDCLLFISLEVRIIETFGVRLKLATGRTGSVVAAATMSVAT